MITASDAPNTLETDKHYVIVPMLYREPHQDLMAIYGTHHQGKPVAPDFSYTSSSNTEWLSVADLREQIRAHVDPDFQPSGSNS